MNLKSILKNLKMHESSISTMLGFVVIVVIGLLIVNYFRQTDNEPSITDGAAIENQNDNSGTHTVAAGESLWTIAEEYYGDGFAWTKIVEANNLANANDIEEGQVLVIPDATPTTATTTVATATPVVTATPAIIAEATPKPTVTEKADTYTVQRGDNLWKIAEAVYGDGYRWTDIARENNLVHPSVIHAGNILKLPR